MLKVHIQASGNLWSILTGGRGRGVGIWVGLGWGGGGGGGAWLWGYLVFHLLERTMQKMLSLANCLLKIRRLGFMKLQEVKSLPKLDHR